MALATVKRFGTLAAHFFTRFARKCLTYFLSKTLPDHVGDGGRFHTTAEYTRFTDALDTHCREASRIVEVFAGEWFSKHNWQTAGDVTREETGRFVAHAMTKLTAELRNREGGRGS